MGEETKNSAAEATDSKKEKLRRIKESIAAGEKKEETEKKKEEIASVLASVSEKKETEDAPEVRRSVSTQDKIAAIKAAAAAAAAEREEKLKNKQPEGKNKNKPNKDDDDDFTAPVKVSKGVIQSRKLTAIVIAALLLILGMVYLVMLLYYSNRFLPNTFVNGVNLEGMKYDEGEAAVIERSVDDTLTFTDKDGKEIVFRGSDYDSVYELPVGVLDDAKNESKPLWFAKLAKTTEYDVQVVHTYSEDSVKTMIGLYNWGNTQPVNAEIVEDENGNFSIQPEDNGNIVKTDVLSKYVINKLKENVRNIDMVEADCYQKADVKSEDLLPTLDLYNRIGAVKITFEMTNRQEIFDPVGTETIDYTTIAKWIRIVDDEIIIDSEQAQNWVRENLTQYDSYTSDYTRKFKTTRDGEITLNMTPTSCYGWLTDVEGTADRLIQQIMSGESASIEPVYEQEGFRMHNHNDYEDYDYTKKTYIEISLERQHLWYYIDGELFLESDVVTGMKWDPSRATPAGIFFIRAKVSPCVLGTMEVQGYECPVDFWMPIDHTGIGLHDLYHYTYGGKEFEYNGSHGCINLPYDTAKQIYNNSFVGIPVIITPLKDE